MSQPSHSVEFIRNQKDKRVVIHSRRPIEQVQQETGLVFSGREGLSAFQRI